MTSYFHGAKLPAKLECGEEFFIIEKELHPACEIYPVVDTEDCNPVNHNYFNHLEGVRLAMNPMYDSRSIDLGAAQVATALDDLERDADPVEYLKYHVYERALEAMFPDDTRFRRVTEQSVKDLDPLTVQAWVREQFTPDRIEINVAGDVDIEHLVTQLNMIFGSLPRNVSSVANTTDLAQMQHRRTDRVGLDIYSKDDRAKFDLGLSRLAGEDNGHNLFCDFPSAVPDRAFTTVLFPANDFRQDSLRRFVFDPILKERVYNAIRREGSFAYFIQQEAFHSILFPGWGYYKVSWAPGAWPPLDPPQRPGDSKTRRATDENVMKSLKAAQLAVASSLSSDDFTVNKPQVVAKLSLGLETLEQWLIIMRGISLPPPATWGETEAAKPGIIVASKTE